MLSGVLRRMVGATPSISTYRFDAVPAVSEDLMRGGLRAAIVGSGGIARIHAMLIEQLGGCVVAVC